MNIRNPAPGRLPSLCLIRKRMCKLPVNQDVEYSYTVVSSLFRPPVSHIMPAMGGDPIRDPDVYPTGRAVYAFDPRQIPTVTADSRGKIAADLIINSYVEKHGKYPKRVGVVLWGFETLKLVGTPYQLF